MTPVLPVLLAAAASAGSDRYHPPPTAHLLVDVAPDHVDVDVVCELPVWNTWLGLDVSTEYLLSDADCARLRDGAAALFAAQNPVAIDGAVVAPVVREVVPPTDFVPGRDMPGVTVRLRFPAAAPPRTVSFHWQTFAATDWFEKPAVPAMVRHAGRVEQAVLTPHEPEYVWHAPVSPPPRLHVDAVDSAPPPPPLRLPLASLLSLGAGGLAAALLRRRRRQLATVLTPLAGGVLLALALRGVWTVRAPFTGVALPDAETALALFERLQNNVYRAFEATSEEEIYDLLAVSVSPRILDELYSDVYESLILRGQGGAVCRIERIEPIAGSVDLTGGDSGGARPSYVVHYAWRVHGLVSHWGHEHRRINQYRADYTVEHDGRVWRIARVVVHEQQRQDDDG